MNGSYYSSDTGNRTTFPAWNASYRVQVNSNDFNAYLTYDTTVWANVSGASVLDSPLYRVDSLSGK